MLVFLNLFFTIAHLALILFNLGGWIWEKTRKAHFITLMVTAGCWFILGIWYGWGYCPLTDWHWQVKEKLGAKNLPNSFIKYIADWLTGGDIPSSVIEIITVSCLVLALIASVYVNFIRPRKKRTDKPVH